jgi:carbonic anhydrase
MFANCNNTDRFTTRILAGLVISVAMVMGSLTYAIANIQVTV